MKDNKFALTCILALSFLLTSGCSRVSVRKELANQGVYRLDENNPYVLTNQYLAENIKDSPITRGFIRSEGTPDALSVKKSFWGNYKTHLYYLPEREAFLLERKSGGAVIKGPARIPEKIYRDLRRIRPLTKPAALVLKPAGTQVGIQAEQFNQARSPRNTNLPRRSARNQNRSATASSTHPSPRASRSRSQTYEVDPRNLSGTIASSNSEKRKIRFSTDRRY